MPFIKEKVKITARKLHKLSTIDLEKLENIQQVECDYKTCNTPPVNGWTDAQCFCGEHKHYWLKSSFKTPSAEKDVEFILSATTNLTGWDANNPQGLLYLNGKMVQGLDLNHTECYLDADTEYEVWIYFYTASFSKPHTIELTLQKRYTEVMALYYDIQTPYEALNVLNENTTEYQTILKELELTCNLIDFRDYYSDTFFESIKNSREYLEKEFYSKYCSSSDKPTVHCIGHTHIDIEWQWARKQTREKMQRSFSSAKALMDKYPEYLFTLSQPELYRYLKEEAPEKYDELKALVKEGRWEPEGAMWVECDCNLTSGESFIRQILHGKKFFKDEFDVDSKILFLPDVFGYSAALPQILKKSGVDYFVTSKISWNETNMLPFDSFMWEGIDGTQIYSSFITAQNARDDHSIVTKTTYVGKITPEMIMGTWDRYQQKEYNSHTILTYGYGDGGGGPTAEMLERYKRLKRGIPGLPVAKTDFLLPTLEEAEKEFSENSKILGRTPTWVGELYLEFHRGTYTSIAKNKRGNRKSEFALQKTETLSYINMLNGGCYDREGLYYNWRKTLHNQFHDILPGSSIHEVYEGTDVDYREISDYCNKSINEKLNSIADNLESTDGIVVYNPLGFECAPIINFNGTTLEIDDTVPAFGWKVISEPKAVCDVVVNDLTAENSLYRLTLDKKGRIVSLFDKTASREIVKDGEYLNDFCAYEDEPYQYDAWEISDYYKSKPYPFETDADIMPVFDGTRAGFKVVRTYMSSTVSQKIWLYSKNPRIDFETEIDWHQKHQVLKIEFPFDIHTNEATYEIQFGHVKRPTHSNTSWDSARFEVCAHKWVDVSENGYGISLLNDCKYGFSAEGSTISLTALKCASYPDPEADEGKHVFTYSLLPHTSSLYDAGVIQESYKLNQKSEAVHVSDNSGTLPCKFSLVSCDADNVIIETAKQAEQDDSLIVRMYEAYDSRNTVCLTVADGFKEVYLCDMMENELDKLEFNNNTVNVPIKNFEIITLKFKR